MGGNVNHPDHYQNIAGVEAIDILNDVVKDLPGKQAAMLWNAMKYLFRFQKKNGVEDLKKARNYLDYLIADIEATNEAAKNIMANSSDILWDTWYSNEYGNMTIYSKTKKPNGMPSKLVFDTKDAVEEFQSVFYNLLSEGYDEFSITDAALEMKFRTTKGNEWNNWDEPINWKESHDNFTIIPFGNKYELIFGYKNVDPKPAKTTSDEHILYKSTVWGSADVYYSTDMPQGTCAKILFNDKGGRIAFAIKFFNYLSYRSHGFSIQDVLEDTKFLFPKEDNSLHFNMPWNDIFNGFRMTDEEGKYTLEFIYKKDDDSEPSIEDWYAYF